MTADQDKFQKAVSACLAYTAGSDRPLGRLAEFYALLDQYSDWDHQELLRLESCLFDALTRPGQY